MSSSMSSSISINAKNTKKRFGLFKKLSKKYTGDHRKAGGNGKGPKNPETDISRRSYLNPEKSNAMESVTSAKGGSEGNFTALTYRTTSFQESSSSLIMPPAASNAKNSTNQDTNSGKSGLFSFKRFTGSSYFRKMCNDVFESIDVDRSGKINQSELYQGLLLIHLKLGLYFGPAACKPISLDRTKFIFQKLDINRDGSLDKGEFQNVMTILMGNVVSRIVFQFVCTILIIPFVAQTILEKTLDGYGYVHCIVTESWLPIFRDEYQPLLEIALGWDLITAFASTAFAKATDVFPENGILDLFPDQIEGLAQFVTQTYDTFVLKPISEIPQETWDSLPLTFLSTTLTLIIVPYSIIKVDDFFRYIANKSGGGKKIKK